MKKNQKRKMISGGLMLMVSVLLLIGFYGCYAGKYHGPGARHKYHGKDISERFLKKLDKKINKLELTDAQQEKYNEIRVKIEEDLKKMQEERRAFFNEVRTEFDKQDPDMDRLAGMMKKKMTQMPDRMEKNIDYFLELYNILDPEQKQKMLKDIRKKMHRYAI